MPSASTTADRLLEGDRAVAAELADGLLKPHRDNLVERPWGGNRLCAFKSLAIPAGDSGRTFGESFEISADDGDDEARLHPSVLTLADGSTITLPALLAVHADTLLGEAFVRRHGRRFPLLPKLLDVAELLSVQAHPPGNTEVYVDRRRRARRDDPARVSPSTSTPARWTAKLGERPPRSATLARACSARTAADELQALLKPWLARRTARPSELETAFAQRLRGRERWGEVEARLATLRDVYWSVLDSLNAIPVKAGDVIYNANPPRVAAASGKPASAEVHALGNPEGRGVFALEIRRPGPTFRAWDNVRFPLRDIDIDATLEALNLTATAPAEIHRRAEARASRRAPLRRLRVLQARAPRSDGGLRRRRAGVRAAFVACARGPRTRAKRRRRRARDARARRVGARPRRRRRLPRRCRRHACRARQSGSAAVCRLSGRPQYARDAAHRPRRTGAQLPDAARARHAGRMRRRRQGRCLRARRRARRAALAARGVPALLRRDASPRRASCARSLRASRSASSRARSRALPTCSSGSGRGPS